MIVDISYNIALLLSLSVVCSLFPFKKLQDKGIVIGLLASAIGLLIMLNPFLLYAGIVFDSRSILICVIGMIFGVVPTVIASVSMAVFRVVMGGDGMVTGLTVITCSAVIGCLWHRFRFERALEHPHLIGWEFYLVGIINHVAMILAMFFMPKPLIPSIVRTVFLPVLGFYPIASFLLCQLLFNQLERQNTINKLEASELRFKTMFEQAPIGMSLTDLSDGHIVKVNQKYLDILGMAREELMLKKWVELTYADDLQATRQITERMVTGDDGPFSLDKRFIRHDGTPIWVNITLSVVRTGFSGNRESLCMTTDISGRKLAEERILHVSTHDALTGLYNRTHFEEHVRHLLVVGNTPLAVLYGDINGLSIINEAFGRHEGDALIRRAAQIVLAEMGNDAYAARVGGDEFALVLPRTTQQEAEVLIESIQNKVSSVMVRGSVYPSITFGMGIIQNPQKDINEAIRLAENDVNTRKLFQSPGARGKAVYAIINTLHEKNKREELHSQRVSSLCERLAQALDMGERQVSELRTVGLLHDIGKIAISDSILNKQGKLDEDEWREMKRHPEIGYRILGAVEEMSDFAIYVLAHHERPDGKGYPKGLSNGDIPLQSRIIAIADSYDAMTSERTYRKKSSVDEAVGELKRCAGTQFDAHLVQVFVEKVLGKTW